MKQSSIEAAVSRISVKTIKIDRTTSIVVRTTEVGNEVEIHTATGAYALPAGALAVAAKSSVPRKPRTFKIPPTAQEKSGRTETPVVKSKMARRYTQEEKDFFVSGYAAAKNKAAFCREHNITVDTVKRWSK